MINIIQRRKFFYTVSSALAILSVLAVLILGIKPGIDFTGGSLLEISYTNELPTHDEIESVLASQEITSTQIQAVNEDGYLIRMPDLTDDAHKALILALREAIGDDGAQAGVKKENSGVEVIGGSGTGIDLGLDFDVETAPVGDESDTDEQNRLIENRFESIGPVIGQELTIKSIQAVLVVLFAILLYIAWAFRKVSWPVQSWKYGVVALITLFHDVVIVFGIYTVLTHLYGWELNTAFVAAILTILGYSVNDTIVVFDRIRENVPRESGSFEEVVNLSVNQTLSRSLITSLTTLFVLVAILIVGGTSIQSFVAALTLGIVIGTYSSIFIASPLLVTAQSYTSRSK